MKTSTKWVYTFVIDIALLVLTVFSDSLSSRLYGIPMSSVVGFLMMILTLYMLKSTGYMARPQVTAVLLLSVLFCGLTKYTFASAYISVAAICYICERSKMAKQEQ